MTRDILGPTNKDGDQKTMESDFLQLVEIYKAVSLRVGENMARNLLRLAAGKTISLDRVDNLLLSVTEVAEK